MKSFHFSFIISLFILIPIVTSIDISPYKQSEFYYNEELAVKFQEAGIKFTPQDTFDYTNATEISLLVRYQSPVTYDGRNKLNSIQKNLETIGNIKSITSSIGGEFKTSYKTVPYVVVRIPVSKLKHFSDSLSLEKSKDIKEIFVDSKMHAMLEQSVPMINADDVWGLGYDGSGVNIAIIDSGVDYNHPDLDGGKVTRQYCFCCDNMNNCEDNDPGCCPDGTAIDDDAMDDGGHGTHCAGIAAGTGEGSGGKYKGVAPGADIWAIKVLNESGTGWLSDIILAIDWVVDPNDDGDCSDHVDIISMSLSNRRNGDGNDLLSWALDYISLNCEVTVVVSAGNEGPSENTVGIPGVAREVITVGSVDKAGDIPFYSSRGPTGRDITSERLKPDVVAPGGDLDVSQTPYKEIVSAFSPNVRDDPDLCLIEDSMGYCWDDLYMVGNSYIRSSGTSMAAPHVAGAAAILKQAHPDWTPNMIKSVIVGTASKTGSLFNRGPLDQGTGKIDVLKEINSKIIIWPTSKHVEPITENPIVQTYYIKNLDTNPVTVELDAEYVYDIEYHRREEGITGLSEDTLTINPGETKDVQLSLYVYTLLGRFKTYYGYLTASYGGSSYKVPYSFYPSKFCFGDISLNINPNTVDFNDWPPERNILFEASVDAMCYPYDVEIRENSCYGNKIDDCRLDGEECEVNYQLLQRPGGNYIYYACIDKNLDGDFDDDGESSGDVLTVLEGFCDDSSDGGFNPFTRGITFGNINGNPFFKEDYCIDSTHVKEYFCEPNGINWGEDNYYCKKYGSSYICSGGRCKESSGPVPPGPGSPFRPPRPLSTTESGLITVVVTVAVLVLIFTFLKFYAKKI